MRSGPVFHPPIPIGHVDLEPIQLGEDLCLAAAELSDLSFDSDQFGFESVNLGIPTPLEHTF
jgi:hypothetical protein